MKPEFWKSEDLARVSEPSLLLAVGLLNYSDDEGFFAATPGLIKSELFPLREPSKSVPVMIDELSEAGFIEIKTGVNGRLYGRVVNFGKHQRVDKKTPSKIKPFWPIGEESPNLPGILPEDSVPEQGTGNRDLETPPAPLRAAGQSTGEGAAAVSPAPSGDAGAGEKLGEEPKRHGTDESSEEGRAAKLIRYLNALARTDFKDDCRSNLRAVRARLHEGATDEEARAVIEHAVREFKGNKDLEHLLWPSKIFKAERFEGVRGGLRMLKIDGEVLAGKDMGRKIFNATNREGKLCKRLPMDRKVEVLWFDTGTRQEIEPDLLSFKQFFDASKMFTAPEVAKTETSNKGGVN